jgi:hypothetical protein
MGMTAWRFAHVLRLTSLQTQVAFLLCAVASSAVTAGVLKQDCMEFVKVLNTVEKILLKVENLESCDSAIDDVREVLEEALGLMNSVQKRGLIASTLLAKSEKNRFEDLKSQLHDALARLNLSSTVEMALLQKTRFDQTEQMRTRLDALGGPKVVLKDPNALKEMESWMEASDQMLMASVGEARKELKTVGDTVAESHWKTVQIAVEQKQHKLLSERSISLLGDTNCKLDMQDQKLDDVTSGFIKLQQEAELSRLQSEILKRQVDELKGMLSEVKGFFNKFPTPPQEPERMLVMNTGNFMALSQNQTPAFETLQSICRDATRKWGVGSTVNMIGDLKQSTVAGCFPTLAKSGAGSCEHPRTAVPAEAADLEPSGEGALCRMAPQIEVEPTDCHGFQAPRKMSVCQHVTG